MYFNRGIIYIPICLYYSQTSIKPSVYYLISSFNNIKQTNLNCIVRYFFLLASSFGRPHKLEGFWEVLVDNLMPRLNKLRNSEVLLEFKQIYEGVRAKSFMPTLSSVCTILLDLSDRIYQLHRYV